MFCIMIALFTVVPKAIAAVSSETESVNAQLLEEVRGLRRDMAKLKDTVLMFAGWCGGALGLAVLTKPERVKSMAGAVAGSLKTE